MRVGHVLFRTELVSVHMLSILLVIHWHAIDARYYRLRRTRFLSKLTSRASCGASAAASSSSGSCCPCACGSTGGWAGSGPSSWRASASCGRSCATAAEGGARRVRRRGPRGAWGARVQRSTGFVWRWPARRSAVWAARRDDRRRFWRPPVRRSAARPVAVPTRVRDFCAMTQQFVCLAAL